MRRALFAFIVVTLLIGFVQVARATPPTSPPGQGECEHGNSGQECREDPNENGQDCEEHGNSGGINEDHCEEVTPSPTPTSTPTPTPTPTVSPSPSVTPSETPTPSVTPEVTPPVVTPPTVCDSGVTFGPWYGDPRINILLEGSGTFTVKGGIQRFSGKRVISVTLECGERFAVNRYKVKFGKTVSVFLNGTLFDSRTAPRV